MTFENSGGVCGGWRSGHGIFASRAVRDKKPDPTNACQYLEQLQKSIMRPARE